MSFRRFGDGFEFYFSLECCRKQLDQIQIYVKKLRIAMGWRIVCTVFSLLVGIDDYIDFAIRASSKACNDAHGTDRK